ncbi:MULTISPECIES: homoserine dehydrogenase [unclassified Streptomyces]|uniref:homoserine dehydrogenase n=1 Tax=unclassified Streptomyces TaxID=2593676 RepID=UPI0006192F96|nr:MULTISPECIES: homoserine dehydrogenase [unclassified Streptomyces]KKD07534.1 homoserine dehydrogenase [Streptomyces sp. WM6386]KKD15145.1 homoserine dehydrogenase [Streptomyces sp. WM6391]
MKRTTGALRVALLGHGTVGAETARALTGRTAELAARIGTPVELAGIALRRPRTLPGIDSSLITTDAQALVSRGDIDVVVELIGGVEPARSLVVAAMEAGASVVTANKALIASEGVDLHRIARKQGVGLAYEAAVAGAVPVLRPLRQSLAGDRLRRVTGIVNGTTNFILDRMTGSGGTFQGALHEAQRLGYAEADPTADVCGADAAAKMAIVARLAFDTELPFDDVHFEGITHIGPGDIAHAEANGCVIKLVGICDRTPDGVNARVHPMLIPRDHPLAGVRDANNGILVEAEAAGELMFHGAGAGGLATSSAVLGDLVELCRDRVAGTGTAPADFSQVLPVRPVAQVAARYHVSMFVTDEPGVLSQVSAVFAEHGVSLETVRQEGLGAEAELALVTHRATDAAVTEVLARLRRHPSTRGVIRSIRLLDSRKGPAS